MLRNLFLVMSLGFYFAANPAAGSPNTAPDGGPEVLVWELMQQGRFEESLDLLDAALDSENGARSGAERAHLWLAKSRIHRAYGEWADAIDALEESLRSDATGQYAEATWTCFVSAAASFNDWQRLAELSDYLSARTDLTPQLKATVAADGAFARHQMGQYENAAVQLAALGFANGWRLVGGFNGVAGSGFDRVFGPERNYGPEQPYADDWNIELSWRIFDQYPHPWVALDSQFGAESDQVCYAATSFHSGQEVDALLNLGAGGAMKVWLNGELVFSSETPRALWVNLYSIEAPVEKGWNDVLVKVVSEEGMSAGLSLRVNGADHSPIPGLEWDPNRQPANQTTSLGLDPQYGNFSSWPVMADLVRSYEDNRSFEAGLLVLELADIGDFEQEYLSRPNRIEDDFGRPVLMLDAIIDLTVAIGRKTEMASVCQETYVKDSSVLSGFLNHLSLVHTNGGGSAVVADLETYLDSHPRSIGALLALHSRLDSSNRDKSRVVLDRIQNLAPNSDFAVTLTAYAKKEDEGAAASRLYVENVWRDNPENPAFFGLLISELIDEGNLVNLAKVNEVAYENHPEQWMYPWMLANAALEVRDLRASTEWCDKALSIAPDEYELLFTRGVLEEMQGRSGSAASWYAKSMERMPDDWATRLHMWDLAGRTEFDDVFVDEETAELIEEDRANPAFSDAHSYRVLKDCQFLTLGDIATRVDLRIVGRVNDVAGVKESTQMGLPLPDRTGSFVVNTVVTIKPDGTRIPGEASQDAVSFSDLAPGDYFEVTYTAYASAQTPMGRHIWEGYYLADSVPVVQSRFQLVHPRGVSLNVRAPSGARLEQDELQGDLVRRSWTLDRQPATNVEASSPATVWSDFIIDLTSVPSWSQVGEWYGRQTHRQRQSTETVRLVARAVVEGETDDYEMALRLGRFVSETIEYSDPQFQLAAIDPNPPETVLDRGLGDCKDQTALLLAMAEAVGIKGTMALVNTQLGHDYLFLPSMRFDHVIARLETSRGSVWIDPTMGYHDTARIPEYLQGTQVLLLDAGESDLVRIDIESEVSSFTLRTAIDMKDPLQGQMHTEATSTGSFEHRLLSALATMSEEEFVQASQAVFAPSSAELLIVDLVVPELVCGKGAPMEVLGNTQLTPSRLGDRVIFQVPLTPSRITELPENISERRMPLVVSHLRGDQSETVSIQLPEGAGEIELPESVSIETPEGSYRLECWVAESGQIVVERELQIHAQRIEPERMKAFAEFVAKLRAGEASLVMYRLADGEEKKLARNG